MCGSAAACRVVRNGEPRAAGVFCRVILELPSRPAFPPAYIAALELEDLARLGGRGHRTVEFFADARDARDQLRVFLNGICRSAFDVWQKQIRSRMDELIEESKPKLENSTTDEHG